MSERDWLAYFFAKRNMGAVICEGPEIEAACVEIDRVRSDYAALEVELMELQRRRLACRKDDLALAAFYRDKHRALVEAVAWERECIRQLDCAGKFWEDDNIPGRELIKILDAARVEVDRLIA